MTTEQLMQPRYKVINTWPRSGFPVGLVFEGTILTDLCKSTIKCDQFPHLFKRLEWWEERKPDDMPEYVKNNNGEVMKVTKWEAHLTVVIFEPPTDNGWNQCYTKDILPATLQQYTEYINQKQ